MKFGILCSLLALTATASAAELYVSPRGSNKNKGTAQSPFATISRAASAAKPGDTVKIAPGIYREQIQFRKSGTQTAPITFIGSRGPKGEFLSIIEPTGTALDKWTPAPEIAPDVWKTPLAKRPNLVMMNGAMIAYINRFTMELADRKELPKELNEELIWDNFGPKCKRLSGLDLMRLPANTLVKHQYFRTRKELFWPVISNILSGWKNGWLYVRFADGSKPQGRAFTATYGEGLLLRDVSYLNFKDLHVRGSRTQFRITGKSSHNTVENSLLMHGGGRVRIDTPVSYTTIRNNIMTSGFTENRFFKLRSKDDMRGGLVYLIFKYIIGTSSSDDVGISDRGSYSRITGNMIIQGLIGMDAYGVNCEVRDNVVREMSSVGICTGPTTLGIFTGNLVMNCGIPLRIHDLRGKRAKREEYHFRNLFVQARHDGQQTYVHCESYRWGPDMVNFEKGTKVYKKNPPNPVDPGKFYIYHNTFWGGQNNTPGFSVSIFHSRFRSAMPFVFVNNVVKGTYRWHPFAQEMMAGNLFYNFPASVSQQPLRYPEIKKENVFIDEKSTSTLWNNKKIPGLYDVTLAKNSPALGVGIDISKPFTYKGRNYPALPGFTPGYFKGKAPAAGAFQEGESQAHFVKMYQKALKAIEIVNNAK